tara:strand:+ start:224 stop:622 length:399 start_codon:yes stop_codon:yes gene_type:complete
MSKIDKDKYIKYLEKKIMDNDYGEYNSARLVNDITNSVNRILDLNYSELSVNPDTKSGKLAISFDEYEKNTKKALEIYSRLSREYYINYTTMSQDEFSKWHQKCKNDSREYDEEELIIKRKIDWTKDYKEEK